jgi:hypothetical protein
MGGSTIALLGPIGNILPAEAEARTTPWSKSPLWQRDPSNETASGTPGTFNRKSPWLTRGTSS